MDKWYVYVSDYGTRVYANIFEAPSKEEVKALLLEEVGDWLPKVKLRSSGKGDNQYITAIHKISGQWVDIFLTPRKCLNCLNDFTKIDKLKYQTGGTADFCSSDCEVVYRTKLDPYATSTWDNGSVYKITHKPSGKFYVGVTTRWVMQRWWEHIKAESGSKFHIFIKERPISEFTFEILESFKPSISDPFEREKFWIDSLKALETGFNSVNGHKSTLLK